MSAKGREETFLQKFTVLVRASRPLAWPLLSVIFFGGLMYSNAELSLAALLQLLALSAPASVFYALNDAYDYHTDIINRRKNDLVIDGKALHPRYLPFVKSAVFVAMAILALSSILTLNPSNMLLMALFLFFAYSYSSPPLRLKERPPLDSIANGICYFLAPVLLGMSFGQSVFPIDAKFLYAAFCVAGVHAFSTVMDYEPDKKAGITTFSIRFGKRAAILLPLFAVIATLLFAGIRHVEINAYLAFCALVLAANLFKTNAEISRASLGAILAGFLVTLAIFLAGQFL